jgi:hypothetical protein
VRYTALEHYAIQCAASSRVRGIRRCTDSRIRTGKTSRHLGRPPTLESDRISYSVEARVGQELPPACQGSSVPRAAIITLSVLRVLQPEGEKEVIRAVVAAAAEGQLAH